MEFPAADPATVLAVPLYIAGSTDVVRIPGYNGAGWQWSEIESTASVRLALGFKGNVAADTIELTLNGVSLAGEPREYTPRNGNRGRSLTSGSYDGLRVVVSLNSPQARGALEQ